RYARGRSPAKPDNSRGGRAGPAADRPKGAYTAFSRGWWFFARSRRRVKGQFQKKPGRAEGGVDLALGALGDDKERGAGRTTGRGAAGAAVGLGLTKVTASRSAGPRRPRGAQSALAEGGRPRGVNTGPLTGAVGVCSHRRA